jgi:hypothetical protein
VEGKEVRVFFFLNKKEAKKTLPSGARAGWPSTRAREKKFFGSFFQKKNRFLT